MKYIITGISDIVILSIGNKLMYVVRSSKHKLIRYTNTVRAQYPQPSGGTLNVKNYHS